MRAVELRVRCEAAIDFYREAFGCVVSGEREVKFPGQDTTIRFVVDSSAPSANHQANAGFWKLGMTLPDVVEAAERLRSRGIEVSLPGQFRDIGFLAHFKDQEGIAWELLGHQFDGRIAEGSRVEEHPLGSQSGLGQVTLRISDQGESLAFYQGRLGMRLLSIQDVKPYRFTLYFLAFTDEEPPHRSIEAVENREWLWQRPYPTLELQHRWDQGVEPADNGGVGFSRLIFRENGEEILDPDGHKLVV